jgi:hypothetical protein
MRLLSLNCIHQIQILKSSRYENQGWKSLTCTGARVSKLFYCMAAKHLSETLY